MHSAVYSYGPLSNCLSVTCCYCVETFERITKQSTPDGSSGKQVSSHRRSRWNANEVIKYQSQRVLGKIRDWSVNEVRYWCAPKNLLKLKPISRSTNDLTVLKRADMKVIWYSVHWLIDVSRTSSLCIYL